MRYARVVHGTKMVPTIGQTPQGEGEMERLRPRLEGEVETRRIHEPPDHKSEPWTEQKQGGDETAHVLLLCSGIASRLARNDPAVKPRIPS